MRHYLLYLPLIKKYRLQQGFTLIEIALVVVLLGLISTAVVRFYSQQLIATQTMQNASDAFWQARLAMERMVIDIRSIQSTNAITTNTSNTLAFTDVNNSTYTYTLSGTNLLCNSRVLASGINSLTFSYFDKNGTSTATLANVRYIKVAINVTKNNTNVNLTTSVYLREMNT